MKKINLGVILIIIALIGVIILGIIDGNSINKHKEEITNILTDYLKVHETYFLIPEEVKDINTKYDKMLYDSRLESIKNELTKYVVEDKIDEVYNNYKANLDSQYAGEYMLQEYTSELIEIRNIKVDGNYILVDFTANTNVKYEKREMIGLDKSISIYDLPVIKGENTGSDYCQIIFEKIGNEYKIVYDLTIEDIMPDGLPNTYMGGF